MKKITSDNWPRDWGGVPAWTMIDREVYDHFLNVLDPVVFYHDHFQAGGAFDTEEDAYGQLHNRFMTFADCGMAGCYYLGLRRKNDFPEKDVEAIKRAMEENTDENPEQ